MKEQKEEPTIVRMSKGNRITIAGKFCSELRLQEGDYVSVRRSDRGLYVAPVQITER